VRRIADRRAAELEARFRGLSIFVEHAGEVGRSHEAFLREVVEQFLPESLRCATGFVTDRTWTSRQQDILIFERSRLPVLFEVRDCVVVDREVFAASIEVRTQCDSKEKFGAAFRSVAEFRSLTRGACSHGLYVWDGPTLELALDSIWDYIREDPMVNVHLLPSVIHVRNRYVLIPSNDGRLTTPPFCLLSLGPNGASEGEAILTVLATMWLHGLQHHAKWPWWISEWRQRDGLTSPVPWPSDLQEMMERH
jgi:hypothetical protein